MIRSFASAALALMLAFGPSPAPAQTAGGAVAVSPESADLPPPGLSVPRPRNSGPVLGATPPVERRHPGAGDDDPYHDDRYRQRRRPPTIVVIRERGVDLTPQVILPPPAPAAPVAPPPAEPLSPHDGPRFVGARGAAPAAPLWTLDQPLAPGVPQLTLTGWRSYGLDAPGPGQSYVRVGTDLLLIDAASRRVLRALPPPG